MQPHRRTSRFLASLSAAIVLTGPQPAKAILNYYIYESGGNVVVKTTGSLNLRTPTYYPNIACYAPPNAGTYIDSPHHAFLLCAGQGSRGYNSYLTLTPPALGVAAGHTSQYTTSSSSGIRTFIHVYPSQSWGGIGEFFIDPSYVSGPIVSTTTFNALNLANMGFTTNGLIGTWTIVNTGDTINVVVGAPQAEAVPGPFPLVGAAAAFGYSRHLRRRLSRTRVAPDSANTISS